MELDYSSVEERGPLCVPNANTRQNETVHRTSHLVLKAFKEEDMFLNEDEDLETRGNEGSGMTLTPNANNQKSLLATETFFLLKALKALGSGVKAAVVVYVGGSPGDHLNLLAELFPQLVFHVYDPVEMRKITPTNNLFTYNEAFTDSTVLKFRPAENTRRNQIPLLFISDMRNKEYVEPKTTTQLLLNAKIIVGDMQAQKRWFQALKPSYALLRFRPLLKAEASCLAAEECAEQASFLYPTGLHLLLPYSKHKSNSTMLLTRPDLPEELYFHHDVLAKIKHHNIHVRNSHVFMNPFTRSFEALLPIRQAKKLFASGENKRTDLSARDFVMNASWDNRAVFFVFCLYVKHRTPELGVESLYERVSELILTSFMRLENASVIQQKPASTLV